MPVVAATTTGHFHPQQKPYPPQERIYSMGLFIVSQSPSNHNKIIAWLTGFLTLLLAFFSFILSFNSLTDLASDHGISIPILFPLVVTDT